jgi:hypothetical protein
MTRPGYIKRFVEDIEDSVYKNELIYRSLIVTKNAKESKMLKSFMNERDYSALLVNAIDYGKDYNTIDERIVIISYDKFKEFMQHLEKSAEGWHAFNLIAMSTYIDDAVVEDLKSYYINKSNNNENDTIIFDKGYQNYLYLQNIVS